MVSICFLNSAFLRNKHIISKNKITILEDVAKTAGQLDIMAQQLKFVACLKILMEELSTLATGFEVDGGQLRYQLYVWLEREVDALRQLCNYSSNVDGDMNNVTECKFLHFLSFSYIVTILEIVRLKIDEILMEKNDFQSKVVWSTMCRRTNPASNRHYIKYW